MATTTTSFKSGQGGRKKGIPNKINGNLREWINNFINDNRQQIQEDWQTLEPKDRILIFEKLLKYTLPTLQATSLTNDFEKMSNEDLEIIINTLKSNTNDD